MLLKDRVAIVTGGGYGIGERVAVTFARHGADLVLAARSVDRMKETAGQVEAQGRQALVVPTDITRESDVAAMVGKAVQELGKIDILVNNSGIAGPTCSVTEMVLDQWEHTLRVNLTGTMLCCRETLKHMIPARRGAIVNLGSTAGRGGFRRRSPYCCSKWAIVGLTQTLALEVAPHQIRVNCVCPGPVEGTRIEEVIQARAASEGVPIQSIRALFERMSPMKRMVTEQEVANAILYLVSDEASGISGHTLDINAGAMVDCMAPASANV